MFPYALIVECMGERTPHPFNLVTFGTLHQQGGEISNRDKCFQKQLETRARIVEHSFVSWKADRQDYVLFYLLLC